MYPERLYAAARNGLAVLLAAEMLSTSPALGEGQVQLILPLVSVMAFGVTAMEATPGSVAPASPLSGPAPSRPRTSLLPSRLLIPDGYAIDFDRPAPSFAVPVDRDRVVAFDLLTRPRGGWEACIAYDQEARRPLPGSADLLRLVVGRRF